MGEESQTDPKWLVCNARRTILRTVGAFPVRIPAANAATGQQHLFSGVSIPYIRFAGASRLWR